MVTNGSFETGDFTGWTVQDLSSPFWPLAVYPSGQQSWPFFSTTPTDGQYVAATGFDGDGASSGFPISIGQDIAVQGTTVMLTFDYRAAWDLTFGATVPRTFGIQIEPAGGGSPIDSIVLLTAAPNTTVNDTGDQLGQIDLSPYAGQTVFVRWTWVVPQDYTGPGMVQVDNVRALRQ
ncbi:MAG TPA: hypothetical protein PK156_14505 [Polyangium sp.]|nr:hypothetical protein [Polyangium sp.]